jgi:hypothetical protein
MKVNSEIEAAISAGEEARRIIDAMSASINITTTGNAASAINSITNALRNLTNGGRPYLVNV